MLHLEVAAIAAIQTVAQPVFQRSHFVNRVHITFPLVGALNGMLLHSVASVDLIPGLGFLPTEAVASDIAWQRASGSRLKPAIHGLNSLKRIQELQARLPHRFRLWSERLGMLDRESNALRGNARLVSNLKFHCRRGPSL
jgi:hypothetical protein